MWPAIGAAAVGGLFSAFGARGQQRASQRMAREQMRFQDRQALRQMDFQERMSSTAYQRAMADMRAAGLNPMLAYQQGGAAPPFGGAMGAGAMGQAQDVLGAGVSSAMASREHMQQIRNMRSQERLTREQGRGSEAIADREEAQNRALGFRRRPDGSIVIDMTMPNITDLVQADLDHLQSQAALAKATARQTLANAKLLEHQEPEARLQRSITESPFGVWSAYGQRMSGAIPRIVPRMDMPLFRRR